MKSFHLILALFAILFVAVSSESAPLSNTLRFNAADVIGDLQKSNSIFNNKNKTKNDEDNENDSAIRGHIDDVGQLTKVIVLDDASMTRYPSWKSPGGLLRGADYAGTLVFALTGTITAAQCGLDVFGSVVVGIITSIGGGTVRDAVFLNRKPFWTEEPEYMWMSLVTGLLAFFLWPTFILKKKRSKQWELEQQQQKQISDTTLVTADSDKWAPTLNRLDEEGTEIESLEDGQYSSSEDGSESDDSSVEICDMEPNGAAVAPIREAKLESSRTDGSVAYYDTVDGALDIMDAIGLSAFAIIGAQNGIRAGMPPLVSALCGVATATFGGMIRDVLCGRPVRIMHSNSEVYALPALIGASAYLVFHRAGGSPAVRIAAAFVVCMGIRFFAVQSNIKLYTWDTTQDNRGIAVRRISTTTYGNMHYRNE